MVDRRRETLFINLGHLSSNYNDLEHWLLYLIWMLIGSDPQIGMIVTARMNMSSLLTLAKRLFDYQIEDRQDLAAFDELLKESNQAAERRNKYIHSVWGLEFGAPPESITRIKNTSKKIGLLVEEMSQEAISEEADFVGGVSRKFFMFNAYLMGQGYFPDYSNKFFNMFDTELDEEE